MIRIVIIVLMALAFAGVPDAANAQTPTPTPSPINRLDCFDFTTDPDSDIYYQFPVPSNHEVYNDSGNDVLRSTYLAPDGVTRALAVDFYVSSGWTINGISYDASSSTAANRNAYYARSSTPSTYIFLGTISVHPTYSHHSRTAFEFPASGLTWLRLELRNNNTAAGVLYLDDVCINYTYTGYSAPTADFTYDCFPSCNAPTTVNFEDDSSGYVTSWAWDFGDGGSSSLQNPSHVYSEPGIYEVELTVTGPGGSDSVMYEVEILATGVPGGLLVRPIAAQDEHPQFGLYDMASKYPSGVIIDAWEETGLLDPYALVAMSIEAGDYVYSIAAGTVQAITPMGTGTNCYGLIFLFNTCHIIYADPDDAEYSAFRFDRVGLFRVAVTFETGVIVEYVVADAPNFVQVGQRIGPGCIVGKTHAISNVTIPGAELFAAIGTANLGIGLNYIVPDFDFSEGAALVRLRNTGENYSEELLSKITVPPIESNACNAPGEELSCIGDPSFARPWDWTVSGPGVPFSSRRTLRPGDWIRLEGINLSTIIEYGLSVSVERVGTGTNAAIRLGIGQTIQTFALTFQTQRVQIAPALHTPNSGTLYDLYIQNTGQQELRLVNNCLSRAGAERRPDECYFTNYSFDAGLTGWTTSGTVAAGTSPGFIIMADDSIISQTATLYPAGAEVYAYNVVVRARVWGDESIINNTTDEVTFDVRFDGGDWEPMLYSSLADADLATFFTYPNNEIMFQALIEVGSVTTGELEIRVNIGPDTDAAEVRLQEACIDDPFSNWTDATGGMPLPFQANCNVVTRPAEDDTTLNSWITYLWLQQDRFFKCSLMVLLNQMYQLIYRGYELSVWSLLYSQAAVDKGMQWLGGVLVPWLNGHFSNIANGRQTFIDGGGDCHDIFCLLTRLIDTVLARVLDIVTDIADLILRIVSQVADLMLPLIGALVSMFISIVASITQLITTLISSITAIIAGFTNAQPVPIPGLPTCQIDPQQNALCATLYGLEHTIFQEEGQLIIPLLVSLLSFLHLQWLIQEIGKIIRDVTDGV
ncbi:PKD domain-containing protein [Anaerolineae bacterium CFX9]|nr:PKD domain-containing protein [Anaerolineae bacterium CFX9]